MVSSRGQQELHGTPDRNTTGIVREARTMPGRPWSPHTGASSATIMSATSMHHPVRFSWPSYLFPCASSGKYSLHCSSFLSEPVSRWLGVLLETSHTGEHAPPQPPIYPDACLHSLPTWVVGGLQEEGSLSEPRPCPFAPIALGR